MDQFEREDSSTYTEPAPQRPFEPAKEEQPVQPQPPVQEPSKPKRSKASLVLSLLLALALAAAGVLGWMWFQQSGEVDNVRSDLSRANNNVSQLESQLKAEQKLNNNVNESTNTDTKDSVSESIVKAGLAYAKADVRNKNTEAKLDKQVDDFAQVTITTESSNATGKISFVEILKKVNDQWVVVWASEVGISDEAIAQYGIPKEFTGTN